VTSAIQTNLHKAVFNASFWTILSHAWNQGIRFIGNLLLTRLLIPEDFGLMQLVFVFIQGITMFSDLGISPNLIQHPDGENPLFLRTTWTVQLIRGIFIEIMLIFMAYPLALLYKAPALAWLLPLAGLLAIIDGATSTNLIMNYRKMEMKKIAFLDMTAQTIGMVVMLAVAWHWRSVWALLISSFVSGSIRTVLSHVIFPGPSMALAWVPKYIHEIIKFGKWIFIGSMAGFVFSRLDRVILGLYISISDLGLYGIAFAISIVTVDLILTLSDKVLIPLYSHVRKHDSPKLEKQVFKVRAAFMAFSLPPLLCMILWGQKLIDFLYPESYRGAGWMLQILAAACCFKCITATIVPILYAAGNSFRPMIVTLCAALILILSIVVEGHFFGTKGVIWAIATAELLNYPILICAIYRYGTWLPWLDMTGFTIVLTTIFFGIQ
jgi:O-antigen/teichoic acid export membrane protein